MRVALVGTAVDRARLRAQMNGSLDVVSEFATISQARESGIDIDAIVVAPHSSMSASTTDAGEEPILEPLTAREIQVLELLAEGLPNKAIAERLRISDQTVKFHVASISGKLGAANRTDAVRRAVRHGLITL